MKYRKFRQSLLAIYLLNILDAIFTNWGVGKKVIQEGNPLMVGIINHPLLLFLIKLTLPLILLLFLLFCYAYYTRYQKFISRSISLILYIYISVFAIHILWIYQYVKTLNFL